MNALHTFAMHASCACVYCQICVHYNDALLPAVSCMLKLSIVDHCLQCILPLEHLPESNYIAYWLVTVFITDHTDHTDNNLQ